MPPPMAWLSPRHKVRLLNVIFLGLCHFCSTNENWKKHIHMSETQLHPFCSIDFDEIEPDSVEHHIRGSVCVVLRYENLNF